MWDHGKNRRQDTQTTYLLSYTPPSLSLSLSLHTHTSCSNESSNMMTFPSCHDRVSLATRIDAQLGGTTTPRCNFRIVFVIPKCGLIHVPCSFVCLFVCLFFWCVCVVVFVKERERERERESKYIYMCVCVGVKEWESERERERERYSVFLKEICKWESPTEMEYISSPKRTDNDE